MADNRQDDISNRLLRSLPPASLRAIEDNLEEIELRHAAVLLETDDPIHSLIFPGPHVTISMIVDNADGDLTEVGIVGNEGFLGVNLLLANAHSSCRALIQIPGNGWRLKASVGERLFESDPAFRSACLRYVQYLLLQISQTALCNRLHSVEERLARWLLLSSERSDSDELPLTHEMLSNMLGTRRATVTLTASMFQEAGIIRYQRGHINIVNRKRLEQASCACFSVQQTNLRRLLTRK
ncbi:MAG: Crp/Fnr family transcriptional regulator [Terriglobales bacterium]